MQNTILTQLFFIFPETEPTLTILLKNEGFQNEAELENYFSQLIFNRKLIEHENFEGFYDAINIKNYLAHYEILGDEYYPTNPKRTLRMLLKDWKNWRDERISNADMQFQLFEQLISDNFLTEVAYRKIQEPSGLYLLVSHLALKSKIAKLEVKNLEQIIELSSLEITDIYNWFCTNRKPTRNYQANPKHGENGIGEWTEASKLLCSHEQAESILNMAIGNNDIDKLYYFDVVFQKFIIFRYEGQNPLNQYHAYHIENENDVPSDIKKLFANLSK